MSMISNKKKAYIGLIALVIIIFGVFAFIITQTKSDKIMKNVYIDNINIGDMSKEESKEILEKQYQLNNILLFMDEKSWNIKPSEIELSYNIDDTVEKAYKTNKGNNITTNIIETIKSIFGSKTNINMEISYDKGKIENIVKKISEEINIEPKNANISINGSNISISDLSSPLVLS